MGTQSENLNRSVGCLEINYLVRQVEFFPEPLGALAGALALVFGQYPANRVQVEGWTRSPAATQTRPYLETKPAEWMPWNYRETLDRPLSR